MSMSVESLKERHRLAAAIRKRSDVLEEYGIALRNEVWAIPKCHIDEPVAPDLLARIEAFCNPPQTISPELLHAYEALFFAASAIFDEVEDHPDLGNLGMEAQRVKDIRGGSNIPQWPQTIERFQAEWTAWALEKFGRSKTAHCLKLLHEADELTESLTPEKALEEAVDVTLLAFICAELNGIDFGAALRAKFEVNKARTWKQKDDGTFQHDDGKGE